MNTVAKLFIDRQERELIYTNINYHRNTWANGKPCTETMGGMVSVTFIPRGDEDDILRWMFADRMDNKNLDSWRAYYKLKKVEIVFYEGDYNGRILFKYKLEDCTCVYYQEGFSNLWGMETTIVLSAAIQYYKNNNTFLIKGWRENWKPPQPYQTPVEEFKDTSPKFTGYYLENTKGERIKQEKLNINQKVYLVIETNNAEGETATINLNNNNLDFEYNGKVLDNDILKGIKILGNITKIQLETVEQNKN